MADLVPGRDCGDCDICCTWMWIDTPELLKRPTQRCRHSVGQGCSIHLTRPPVCRAWFCGWRMLAELNDAWLPDRMGVVVLLSKETPPPGYEDRTLVDFHIVRPIEQVPIVPLIQAIGAMIARGAPVMLSVPRGAEHHAISVFLNEALAEAVAARDGDAMVEGVIQSLEAARAHPTDRIVFARGGPDFARPIPAGGADAAP